MRRSFWVLLFLFITAAIAWATVVNAYLDFAQTGAPSNPSSGLSRMYFDSTAHTLKCLNSDGSSCAPSGGGGSFSVAQPYATDGTSFFSGMFKATKLVDSGFAWLNQSTATITTESAGTVVMTAPGDSAWHLRIINAPSTPYGILVHFQFVANLVTSSQNFGPVFSDGTQIQSWSTLYAGAIAPAFRVYNFTNASTFSAQPYNSTSMAALQQSYGQSMAICDDGTTNITFGHAPDYIHWTKDFTVGRTSFLTPSKVGWGINGDVAVPAVVVDSWVVTTCPF
jgi:hypothetical protein